MILKKIASGIAAGIAVSIGGMVFLSCDSRYVGAALFSVALVCICLKGYALFTGRVGNIPAAHSRDDVQTLLLCLLGNLLGTLCMGLLTRLALPAIAQAAETACQNRLIQTAIQTLARGLMCGMLMYLAVSTYKEKNTIAGILLCIPTFILCGFEHSIADMYYFAASGIVSLRAFGFIWLVIIGNSLGGMLLPVLTEKLGAGKA